jgi:DNA-binding transcriptional MerR regulator
MMAILGDVWVKMRNFPEADKIGRRLKAMLPPQIAAMENEGQQQPQIPPEVQQAMQEAAQQIQELQQKLAQAESGLQLEQLRAQVQIQTEEIRADSRRDVEELKGIVQMLLAQQTPPPALAANVAQDLAQR